MRNTEKVNFDNYLKEVGKLFKTKKATEHTYRSAHKAFVESFGKNLTAINEPKRIDCGAPDYIVQKKGIPLGYIEAKDITCKLDDVIETEQIKKYRDSLSNLILTNYLEFRWFVNGELQFQASLGKIVRGNLVLENKNFSQVSDLICSFLDSETPTVSNSLELSSRLAALARIIKNSIRLSFNFDEEDRWLRKWLKAFREILIDDLDEDTFSSMFAETMTYGLFAARVHCSDISKFSRINAAHILPKTNIFLQKLFHEFAGPDMPPTISWAVDEIVELLKKADMKKVLKGFGHQKGKVDPVIHFYEDFLLQYDSSIKELRGVYYTPDPVVEFISNSVDEVLIKNFKKKQGLADKQTLILDPAIGTGSFLHTVIKKIHSKFKRKQGAWSGYVNTTLLERIFGFEILMAPYAIAHLKLGLMLKDTGYKFQKQSRLGVYMTNTLEETAKRSQELLFDWLSDEAHAASKIKSEKPIMVVMGNPPYKGHSANNGEWISKLLKGFDTITEQKVADYFSVDGQKLSKLGEKNTKWLNNDYVKFIRFAQWRVESTGYGIVAFITPRSYLFGPTFRGMRESICKGFHDIYIIDLHGDKKIKEKSPDGKQDDNVFDIEPGVSINIFIREDRELDGIANIHHTDVWGKRDEKYNWLSQNSLKSVKWESIEPSTPDYYFTPKGDGAAEGSMRLNEMFETYSLGILSEKDGLVVSFEEKELKEKLRVFIDPEKSDKQVSEYFKIPLKNNNKWDLAKARDAVTRIESKDIRDICYRPFDFRKVYYSDVLIARNRINVLEHLIKPPINNRALIVGRQGQAVSSSSWNMVFGTDGIADQNVFRRGGGTVFPLFRRSDTKGSGWNDTLFSKKFLDLVKKENSSGGKWAQDPITPMEFFNYVYALLHSHDYRSKYAEDMSDKFPSIIIPSSTHFIKEMAEIGDELFLLHVGKSGRAELHEVDFPIAGNNKIEKYKYDQENFRILINKTQYIGGITPDIWSLEIGGYPVLEKWLKDRKGRVLNDIFEFEAVVSSVIEMIDLMNQVDEVIAENGGLEAGNIDTSVTAA